MDNGMIFYFEESECCSNPPDVEMSCKSSEDEKHSEAEKDVTKEDKRLTKLFVNNGPVPFFQCMYRGNNKKKGSLM